MVVNAAGHSDFFWDAAARLARPLELRRKREEQERLHPDPREPRRASKASVVSRLSVEISEGEREEEGKGDGGDEDDGEEDVFGDAEEEGPERRMVCRRCGGRGFNALRGEGGVRLVCQGCGFRLREGS